MNTPTKAIALCALGLEKVCAAELERLGLSLVGREPGRVRFSLAPTAPVAPAGSAGSPATAIARANLCLRSAERVMVEAGRFRAADFDELFEGVRALPWELYFRREDRLVIERVRLRDSVLAAQTAVQAVVHKAVYERLGEVYRLERMPETGRERSMRVYIDDNECLVGLDTSGEALHRRGYRKNAGEAPLKETLAAGILLLSGWNRRFPLLDPFCGTGTIAVEAALFAMDRAPGLGRAFAFEDMPFAGKGAFEAEVEAARSRIRKDVEFRISGSDSDPRAIEAAQANAARAGLGDLVKFTQARAEDAAPEFEKGYILCNPPYGERMGSPEEAEALYRRLADTTARFTGWGFGFVTNRPDFGDFFGRYAPTARHIVNGAEEQWFHWYPAGSEAKSGHRPADTRRPAEGRERDPGKGEHIRYQAPDRKPSRPQSRPWVGPDKPGWIKKDKPVAGRDTTSPSRPFAGPARSPAGPERRGRPDGAGPRGSRPLGAPSPDRQTPGRDGARSPRPRGQGRDGPDRRPRAPGSGGPPDRPKRRS